MAEDIDIPKIGSIPKKTLILVGVGAAAFIGWRYWQSRGTSTDDTSTTVDDGDFGAIDSSIPGVIGAVSPTNSYGGDTGDTGDTSGSKTTDAEWTNDVVTGFASAGSTTSGDDVLQALGLYLNNQPMTTDQKSIVQRAIAIAGYPYGTGAHTVVSGGDTALTIAPSGLHVTGVTGTTATISFTGVSGAHEYRAYRGLGGNVATSSSSPITLYGLTPNTSYSVNLQAVTESGKLSPKSPNVTVKTSAVSLAKPATPTVSGIGSSTATAKTSTVKGATGYNWYINGIAHGHSDGASYTLTGLHANTSYKVSVAADTSNQTPGSQSATRTFKTKK